ncbi:MAG: CBS domain-containing membrane protein [Roseibaca calidilacus]|uniref:CBS domain-containing membrane protein n=1 Tax=Roseibaca calidilacus TaxID=1666912 RepID=A0A0P7WPG0_9RHOB|nr:HPP family protein [Roseibaca calidilacus]KPP95880.1 MAG: CBS domain-containing membrane protein [Roseibaca calidilacus]CUX81556.1 CBS domain-containing membrane protein [Roseibaca calidilacus]
MWKSLGPAMARVTPLEALRASFGALVAIALIAVFLLAPEIDTEFGLYLVAPFGASAVMVFAIPNSPLAQPWSVIVGNMLGALIGVAMCYLVPDASLRVALAVAGAAFAMAMLRALHPPAGGVAMAAALHPEEVFPLGFWFVLTPIGLGAVSLVAMAAVYARLTGRIYPFRQYEGPDRRAGNVQGVSARLGLSEGQLSAILERYRQSSNLGAADLARLIGAAQMEAAAQFAGPLTAREIMSPDPVTVAPDTPLGKVAELFQKHRFTTIPVVGADGRYMGSLHQIDLIARAARNAGALKGRFGAAMARLLGQGGATPEVAQDILRMGADGAAPETPLAALLPLMADGEVHAVPVIDAGRVVGVVSRTDLVAVLARRAALGAD